MYNEQLVSVIIPAFNPDMYLLERAIDSVIAQSYRFIEILICDDGSDIPISQLYIDSLVKEKSSVARVKLLRHDHNEGISAARNTAVRASTGKWLIWLDADDMLDKRCIENLVEKAKGKTLIIGECIVTEYGSTSRRISRPYFEKAKYLLGTENDPFLLNVVAIQPQLFDHIIYDKLGGFDPDFIYAELTELFLRYLASEGLSQFQYCENAVYHYDRTNERSHTTHREELFHYRTMALRRYMSLMNLIEKDIVYIGRDAVTKMQRYALTEKTETLNQTNPKLLCHS